MHPSLAPPPPPPLEELQEPLLLLAQEEPDGDYEHSCISLDKRNDDDDDDDDDEQSVSTYYYEEEEEGPQKTRTVVVSNMKNNTKNQKMMTLKKHKNVKEQYDGDIADVDDVGLCSCLHWYISKFAFPLLLAGQHAVTLVLLVPFMGTHFFDLQDDEKVQTWMQHALFPSPQAVFGANMALLAVLACMYVNEKEVPHTTDFLLRILHPAILMEMNVALMLILHNKEEVAIVTLLASMVGVLTFVVVHIQSHINKVQESERNKKYRADWV